MTYIFQTRDTRVCGQENKIKLSIEIVSSSLLSGRTTCYSPAIDDLSARFSKAF